MSPDFLVVSGGMKTIRVMLFVKVSPTFTGRCLSPQKEHGVNPFVLVCSENAKMSRVGVGKKNGWKWQYRTVLVRTFIMPD